MILTSEITSPVLIHAPVGKDSFLISEALKNSNIATKIVRHQNDLSENWDDNIGIILLAEEAISLEIISILNEKIDNQETWSDIPIIILTKSGGINSHLTKIMKLFANGNIMLLERPCHPSTLITSIRGALRARQKQFEVKKLLVHQLESMRMREEFISIASHELKTPITSMKLQNQIFKRMMSKDSQASLSPEKLLQTIDTNERQINRLMILIDDMLDISRIDTGKLLIQKTKFDIKETIEELAHTLCTQLETAGCEVSVEAQGETKVHWDRFRIEQVLTNLFTNSMRYASGKAIKIKIENSGDHMIINFTDYGRGIEGDNLEKIFDRFERAYTGGISGLGLGLYISRQIVEAHGGTIKAQNLPGKGANFLLKIPKDTPL